MSEVGKYPAYAVRDDSAELGTISLTDDSNNTLFIRDRTCLGIHEDAYLMTAAPKLAHALELLWESYMLIHMDANMEGEEDPPEYAAMRTLVQGALAAARGEKT